MNGTEIFRLLRALALFVVGVALLWFVIMIRDYRLDTSGGFPTFVARISIPRPSGVRIRNNESKKLTLSTSSQSGADGYEFQISGYKNMFFPHTYSSATPKKEVGKLKSGKTYYARVRCYKKNARGRTVYGRWSGVARSVTKEDDK